MRPVTTSLLLALLTAIHFSLPRRIKSKGVCEPLTIELCGDLGYNTTYVTESRRQADSAHELHTFYPLIEARCSKYLKEFLCSFYFPECSSAQYPILPCKAMCEKAKSGCLPVLQSFRFFWPKRLRCNKFPDNNCRDVALEDRILPQRPENSDCEPVTITSCKDVGYNFTSFPNSRATTQNEAGMMVAQFHLLIRVACSEHLKRFLCSAYVPECTVTQKSVYPCRSLCQKARDECSAATSNFGFTWQFDCNVYPTENCVQPEMDQHVEAQITAPNCEPVSVPMCKGVGYNFTSFPNSKAETQSEAGLVVHQFYPLIKVGCSEHLVKFICSAFLPECTSAQKIAYPCRSLCQKAKDGCIAIIRQFHFTWPFDCDAYSTENCVQPEMDSVEDRATDPGCQNLPIGSCQYMGYDSTFQALGHQRSHEEIGLFVQSVFSFVSAECFQRIEEMVCLTYFPPCQATRKSPCRSFCNELKNVCDLSKMVSFTWPEEFDCGQLPVENCSDPRLLSQSETYDTLVKKRHVKLTTLAVSQVEDSFKKLREYVTNLKRIIAAGIASSQTESTYSAILHLTTGMENNIEAMKLLLQVIMEE